MTITPRNTPIPLILQVGFAGSRFLYDSKLHPNVNSRDFQDAAATQLTARLKKLLSECGYAPGSEIVGISAAAVGADLAFIRACKANGFSHRILLPQERNAFLDATSTSGTPDFTAADKATVTALLSNASIIEECVVGTSDERDERFHQVNLEIVRECDVMICLVRKSAEQKHGGTLESYDLAMRRKRPVILINVDVDGSGLPVLEEDLTHFKVAPVPAVPAVIDALESRPSLQSLDSYCAPVKVAVGAVAISRRDTFGRNAFIVVGAHVFATACAVVTLALKPDPHEIGPSPAESLRPWLTGIEFLALVMGLSVHRFMHRSHVTSNWATARLIAEVIRSAVAANGTPGRLAHLFTLPLPSSLKAFVTTLNVLHLRDLTTAGPWKDRRDSYRKSRLEDKKKGQIEYYERARDKARSRLKLVNTVFYSMSGLALLATGFELATTAVHFLTPAQHMVASSVLGAVAIFLPVLSVGALSLSASFDLEGRVVTYDTMLSFLKEQDKQLNDAQSEHEFGALVLETETGLLGETLSWYSRRKFTGVN